MNSSSIVNYEQQFEKASNEFEAHWDMGREAARNAAIKLNEMVSILHNQYPGWSMKKIVYTIWNKHEHLEGLSKTTIYDNLDEANRMLLDTSKQNNQKNVLEESVPEAEQNIIEESSSDTTKTLPTAYEVKDAETVQDPELINSMIGDDNDEPESEESTWQFKTTLEIKGQEIPLIVTVYPDTASGKVEVDEQAARRLNKRK